MIFKLDGKHYVMKNEKWVLPESQYINLNSEYQLVHLLSQTFTL